MDLGASNAVLNWKSMQIDSTVGRLKSAYVHRQIPTNGQAVTVWYLRNSCLFLSYPILTDSMPMMVSFCCGFSVLVYWCGKAEVLVVACARTIRVFLEYINIHILTSNPTGWIIMPVHRTAIHTYFVQLLSYQPHFVMTDIYMYT